MFLPREGPLKQIETTLGRADQKLSVLGLRMGSNKNEKRVYDADGVAFTIYKTLKPHMTVFYDEKGAVGRRYRRQDEVGTPLCVTIDFDTLADRAVPIRDRDTMAQERVPIDGLLAELQGRLS